MYPLEKLMIITLLIKTIYIALVNAKAKKIASNSLNVVEQTFSFPLMYKVGSTLEVLVNSFDELMRSSNGQLVQMGT